MSQETHDMLTEMIADIDNYIDSVCDYTAAELDAMNQDEFLEACFE